MDKLPLVFGPELSGQIVRRTTHESWHLRAVVIDKATRNDLAVRIEEINRITGDKDAGDRIHAGWQQ